MRRPFLLLALLIALACTPGCGREDDGLSPQERRHHLTKIMAGKDENVQVDDTGLWRKVVVTSAYELEPWRVAFHAEPFRTKPFSIQEAIWITGWRSNTEDPSGLRAPDDIHCHAFFSNASVRQSDTQIFSGIYTDGFTPEFNLPDGFALRIPAGQKMVFQPMFNNRRPTGRRARMRLEVDYYLESGPKQPTEVKSFTMSSSRPDIYWVPPREPGTEFYRDVKVREVDSPATGRIHGIGAHLHPYGKYVELRRARDDTILYTARMIETEHLEDQRLSHYSSSEGVYLRQGERLIITTVYENPLDEKIDAMGGIFVFYDPHGEPDA